MKNYMLGVVSVGVLALVFGLMGYFLPVNQETYQVDLCEDLCEDLP